MKLTKLQSGLVIPKQPEPKKEPERKYDLLEVREEEYRERLSDFFRWALNYPCKSGGGIVLDAASFEVHNFRHKKTRELAKDLLGKDWDCEILC